MSGRGQRGTTTPIYARILDEEQTESFPKGQKKWTGWKPKKDEQKIEFRKKMMEVGEDMIDEGVASIQKTLVIAAGRVAHHTKADCENYTEYAGGCQIT